jgi:hypothetical protein
MGAVAKPRWAVVWLMILTLGVSLGLSAEDVLDAVYDESEALPYEVIPLDTIVVSPPPGPTAQPVPTFVHRKTSAPSLLPCARFCDAAPRRCAVASNLLALLCTLTC